MARSSSVAASPSHSCSVPAPSPNGFSRLSLGPVMYPSSEMDMSATTLAIGGSCPAFDGGCPDWRWLKPMCSLEHPRSEWYSALIGAQSATLDRTFFALSDPTRRRILEQLASGPATIGELARPLDLTLNGVKKACRHTRGGRPRRHRQSRPVTGMSARVGAARGCDELDRRLPPGVAAPARSLRRTRGAAVSEDLRFERVIDAPPAVVFRGFHVPGRTGGLLRAGRPRLDRGVRLRFACGRRLGGHVRPGPKPAVPPPAPLPGHRRHRDDSSWPPGSFASTDRP